MRKFIRIVHVLSAFALMTCNVASASDRTPVTVTLKDAESAVTGVPDDETANKAIDASFIRWSSTWFYDRYLSGSARVKERGLRDDTYVLRGTFDFARSGSKQTIPFAAAFSKGKDGYTFSNLCYNDTSSGITDCINPSDNLAGRQMAAMQSQQVLGSIVLLGLVAAMTDDSSEDCVERETFFGERYWYCYD